MSQTKTPPWEWEKKGDSPIEHILEERYLVSDRDDDIAQRAWSELCALQAVAEAAEDAEEALGTVERWVNLRTALKEWRAICPRNVV